MGLLNKDNHNFAEGKRMCSYLGEIKHYTVAKKPFTEYRRLYHEQENYENR